MLSDDLSDRIIGDKAYDSDRLDEELAEQGIELIAPHRGNPFGLLYSPTT